MSSRNIGLVAAAALATASALAGTSAAAADFSGTWAVSSTIMAHGRVVGTATPVCKFEQRDGQLNGYCRGPHARGPISGMARGASISWQWSTTATTAYGLTGMQYFRGTLYPDGIIRGTSSSSNLPGRGSFTAQRE